jgi:hypothetical protein
VQRHTNSFSDMIHHRASKDKSKEPIQEHGGNGENAVDKSTDERVVELERALETAREEQNAMREELAKLKEHGSVYRETIEDYRRQVSNTYSHPPNPPGAFHTTSRPTSSSSATTPMDYEQSVSPRRTSTKHRREGPSEQIHDLRSQVAQLQDQLASQESHYHSREVQLRSRNEAEWNDLTSRLHATEKESQERLHQLLSLKSSISSLTRMDAQITDSELTETLAQLANRVREWVVSNFRRAKLDMCNLPPETAQTLETVSPNYSKIDPSNRLALYQALISNVMMRIFREPIVVGLPETGPLSSVRQVAAYIHDASANYRDWRRVTIQNLQKSEAQQILRRERETLTHRLCGEIAHQLFTLTSTNLTPAAQDTLRGIFQSAADLQNTLLLQKAQYRILFFCNERERNVRFDERTMESINDLDGSMDTDMVVERKFSFCVSPCLDKFGDEYGEHANVRNVLLKASVCCDGN